MRDEELKSQADYSAGQTESAHRVIVEIMNILSEYRDDMLIVGGWVPDLLFPGQDHVGSIDVDMLLNHLELQDSAYENIERVLLRNGYRKHPQNFFSFVKDVVVDGQKYEVDLDILASMYGGTADDKRSQHIQGLKALKATGGNFAFEVEAKEIEIEAKRPDGALDFGKARVISIVPYLVMKTAALGRGKPKDAYDIYFCVRNYQGGVRELSKEFEPYLKHGLILEMKEKLQSKFASPEHAGPVDVASFLGLEGEEEIEMRQRDAFEQISALLDLLE